MDRTTRMDWDVVREAIKSHGMRNSNTMAIAPTATISNIAGVTQSIEPTYSHLFAKSNLSGDFTVVNNNLVQDLKDLGLWDSDMIEDLKYYDGSVKEIGRIPATIRRKYVTAFETDASWLIQCASRRQKWIDMGQSLNLYIAAPSGAQAKRDVPERLALWSQDDLLPAQYGCHPDREVYRRREPPRYSAALDEEQVCLGQHSGGSPDNGGSQAFGL